MLLHGFNRGRQTVVIDWTEWKVLLASIVLNNYYFMSLQRNLCAVIMTKLCYSSNNVNNSRISSSECGCSPAMDRGSVSCFFFYSQLLFVIIFPVAFPWPWGQTADRWTTQLYEQDGVRVRQQDVHLTASILLWKTPSHKLLIQSRKHCVISLCRSLSLCLSWCQHYHYLLLHYSLVTPHSSCSSPLYLAFPPHSRTYEVFPQQVRFKYSVSHVDEVSLVSQDWDTAPCLTLMAIHSQLTVYPKHHNLKS